MVFLLGDTGSEMNKNAQGLTTSSHDERTHQTRIGALAVWLRDLGTEGYPPASQRRLRQVNVLNAFLVASYLSFAALYAALDWHALKLLSLALIANIPFFILPPFLHRYSEAAAVTYIGIHSCFAFLLLSLIVGSASGIHFWLLAAGALIVFYGTEWILLSFATIACMVGTMIAIEFWVPRFTTIAPITPLLAAVIKTIAITGVTSIIAAFIYLAMHMASQSEAALEREYARSEGLLSSILPRKIAARLKHEPQATIADKYDQVTLLFADLVNFTPKASLLAPEEVVAFLNRVFSTFDELAEKHGLEKIKTIGDAYMVAGGLPEAQPDQVEAVVCMALDMLDAVDRLSRESREEIAVRIGIHTGPAVAGVLGKRKLFYDTWGDTVNTAARLEEYGSPGRIQVSEEVYKVLSGNYAFEDRGIIDIKGKGLMKVYFLLRREPHDTA